MDLQKYKIYAIFDLVFIIPTWAFNSLQFINLDRLIINVLKSP